VKTVSTAMHYVLGVDNNVRTNVLHCDYIICLIFVLEANT